MAQMTGPNRDLDLGLGQPLPGDAPKESSTSASTPCDGTDGGSYRSSIKTSVETVAKLASTVLKQHIFEAPTGTTFEAHILDLGDGVRLYCLKSDAPSCAQDALRAIKKCNVAQEKLDDHALHQLAQLFFELGSLSERLSQLATTQRPEVRPRIEKSGGTARKTTGSNVALKQLKKQAAEEAVLRFMDEYPDQGDNFAVAKAAEELGISPRTLRKWRSTQ